MRADVERSGGHGVPAFEAARPAFAVDPVERATCRLVEHDELHRHEVSGGDQQPVPFLHSNAVHDPHDPVFELQHPFLGPPTDQHQGDEHGERIDVGRMPRCEKEGVG